MREARLLRQTTVQRGTVLGQGSLASRALTPSTSIRTSPVSWWRHGRGWHAAVSGTAHCSAKHGTARYTKTADVHEPEAGSPCEWQQAGLSWIWGLSLALVMALGQGSPRPALAYVESTGALASLQGGAATLTRPQASSTQELKVPPAEVELSAEERATTGLFQAATPSVVNIINIRLAQLQLPYALSMDVPMEMEAGMGSGFIWDTDGHIVTNYHVIRDAAKVQVTLIDHSVWPAKVVGGDPDKDVAVLQLEDVPREKLEALKPISTGTSTNLLVGQKVYAIGNPFGLQHTLTQGIISGLGRELPTPGPRPLRNVIQTDAAINPGNSGGVLLDSRGRLIGINCAIVSTAGASSGFAGVGFALPIDNVKGLVEQVLKYGRVVRPVLGITLAPPQAVRQLGQDGVLVLKVLPGTPAYKAGLQPTYRNKNGQLMVGDIIKGVNDRPVKTQGDLFDILDECRVGQEVQIIIMRNGRLMKVSLSLAEKDPNMD